MELQSFFISIILDINIEREIMIYLVVFIINLFLYWQVPLKYLKMFYIIDLIIDTPPLGIKVFQDL